MHSVFKIEKKMCIRDRYTSVPIEVTVGGATIFVLDVDRFEKV